MHQLFQSVPVEARRLSPETIREVAEWMAPLSGGSGYSWYQGSPARLRTEIGEVVAAMDSWIVCLGTQFVALDAEEFDKLFRRSDG